jgi:segregation and condensation protein B
MLKAKIEAVLFLTDKPMKAQVIARTLNQDVNVVRQALLELIHDYEERKGGLELADDNGYIIQVKDEYSSLINEFAPLEVPLALLRTLSAIAIKQPVQQSEIIKIRGAGAYDHIRELMIRELIIKKDADEGRSPLLSTTKKFQEYFRLSGDGKSLRTELRKKDKTEDIQPVTADAQAIQLQLDEAINIKPDDVQAPAASTDDLQIAAAASAGVEPISLDAAAQATVAATAETISFEVDPDAILPTGTVRKLTEIFDASPDNTLVFQPDAKVSDASDDQTVVPPSPTTESANN